jgi:membrane protein implicated in regulation of membrane protease activity
VLVAAEMAAPGGFFIIFFGLAAVVVGALAGLGFGGPLWLQILLFSALSVASLAVFRARLLRWFHPDPQTPPVDSLVGEAGVVPLAIAPGGIGKVELRGSSWSARNVSPALLPGGARCRVVRVDGLMLDVIPEGVH